MNWLDCQNRPQGMKTDEWYQLHDITKASYYCRLRKVHEAYLAATDYTQTQNIKVLTILRLRSIIQKLSERFIVDVKHLLKD